MQSKNTQSKLTLVNISQRKNTYGKIIQRKLKDQQDFLPKDHENVTKTGITAYSDHNSTSTQCIYEQCLQPGGEATSLGSEVTEKRGKNH